MTIIACVDDSMGMMFNNRRQSRDAAVIDEVFKITEGKRLFVSEYSSELFGADRVVVCNELLDVADEEDYCFIEGASLGKYREKIKGLILFYWNRSYPYDVTLDISAKEFIEVSREDFTGNSHKKITKAVYVK